MSESTYTLSAIFALFAVTWKITLKTAPNKGSKNGTQNHFSESSMTLFWYFVCIFLKKQERTVWCQDLASIQNGPAARCKLLLCPSTPPNWRNAVGLKSYAGKALFKGSSKRTDTQTCLPSRTSRFLPRKFRNAQN